MPDTLHIPAGAWLMGSWYFDQLGHGEPHPFHASFDDRAAYHQHCARLLYNAWGDIGYGSADPQPHYSVPQHDGRIITANAFGSPYPSWDEISGSFWLEGNAHPWAGLSTVAEVERLSIPDWSRNPLVLENIQKWEEYRSRFGIDAAKTASLAWTEYCWSHPVTQKRYDFCVVPTFLDLGSFLLGPDTFLTLLASDPDLSHALLKKLCQISLSQCEFMCQLYGRPKTGWCSMGGDNSCLVSADMYRTYAMEFDRLVRAHFGPMPCNLHSCGASKHLYETWGDYPDKHEIVLMQTRAIPGAMGPLRRSLPNTFIQLTILQPQFNFESEKPERIRELVWELAEALDFRDGSIDVIFSAVTEQCKTNILALREAGKEVNREAARRGRPTV